MLYREVPEGIGKTPFRLGKTILITMKNAVTLHPEKRTNEFSMIKTSDGAAKAEFKPQGFKLC